MVEFHLARIKLVFLNKIASKNVYKMCIVPLKCLCPSIAVTLRNQLASCFTLLENGKISVNKTFVPSGAYNTLNAKN